MISNKIIAQKKFSKRFFVVCMHFQFLINDAQKISPLALKDFFSSILLKRYIVFIMDDFSSTSSMN